MIRQFNALCTTAKRGLWDGTRVEDTINFLAELPDGAAEVELNCRASREAPTFIPGRLYLITFEEIADLTEAASQPADVTDGD